MPEFVDGARRVIYAEGMRISRGLAVLIVRSEGRALFRHVAMVETKAAWSISGGAHVRPCQYRPCVRTRYVKDAGPCTRPDRVAKSGV